MKQSLLHHKIYQQHDHNEWLVLIHGAGGSSAVWFKQLRAYRERYNVLLLDLRGHGGSNPRRGYIFRNKYSFDTVTHDVELLLDHLQLPPAHFVGLSLGTIIVRNLAERVPQRVKSMTLGGAVIRLNIRSRLLVSLGNLFKNYVPYMWLYRLFAYVIMPSPRNAESRNLFVREARKLCQREFKRWFELTSEVTPLMRYFREKELRIPTLYIMGEDDYMFLNAVKEVVKRHQSATLSVIKRCGHVCNVESPSEFNRRSLEFFARHSQLSCSTAA